MSRCPPCDRISRSDPPDPLVGPVEGGAEEVLVGVVVDEHQDPAQRHQLCELRDLGGDPLVPAGEAAQVEQDAVAAPQKLLQRLAPQVVTAEQLADPVAPVGVRIVVEVVDPPAQLPGGADEPAGRPAAEQVEELVRLERGGGEVRPR